MARNRPAAPDGRGGASNVVVLLILISVWSPLADYGYPEFLETARYATFPLIALFAFFKSGPSLHISNRFTPANWFLVFAAYGVISALWADEVGFTLIKACLFAVSVATCYSVSQALPKERIIASIGAALSIFIVLGIAAALLFPSIAVESSYQHAGKWRGLSGQKNVFGLCAAVLLICMWAPKAYLPSIVANHRYVRWAVIACGLLAIIMSQSRGALADLLVGATVLLSFRYLGTLLRPFLVLLLLLGPACVFFVASAISLDGTIVTLFDLDFDTSNRILIWRFGFTEWAGREILGFGYGGFWSEDRTQGFRSAYGWALPNFHSGYISLIIETGIAGTAIFAMFALSALWGVINHASAIRRSGAGVLVALIVMFLAHNVYENNLTRSTDFFLLCFMLSVFAFSRKLEPAAVAKPSTGKRSAREAQATVATAGVHVDRATIASIAAGEKGVVHVRLHPVLDAG